MHAGKAVVETFKDLLAHPGVILATAGIFCLPLLFGNVIASLTDSILVSSVASWGPQLPIRLWLAAILIKMTRDFATGSSPSVGRAIDNGTDRRLLSFIATKLLMNLIYLVVFVVAIAPGAVVVFGAMAGEGFDFESLFTEPAAIGGMLFVLLGFLAFFVMALLVFLRIGVAPVVCLLEERTSGKSISRSNELMKGHKGDLFVMLLIWVGISMAIGAVLNGPAIWITFRESLSAQATAPGQPFTFGNPFAPSRLEPTRAIIVGISTFLTTIVAVPVWQAMLTNFYLGIKGDEAAASMLPATPVQMAPVAAGAPQVHYTPGSLEGDPLRGPVGHGENNPGQQQGPAGDEKRPGDLAE